MIKLPTLLRLPKHRRFDYQPRYFDPEKEQLEERIERIRGELTDNGRDRSNGIRSGLRTQRRLTKRSVVSPMAWFVILTILVAITYFVEIDLSVILLVLVAGIYYYIRFKRKRYSEN